MIAKTVKLHELEESKDFIDEIKDIKTVGEFLEKTEEKDSDSWYSMKKSFPKSVSIHLKFNEQGVSYTEQGLSNTRAYGKGADCRL